MAMEILLVREGSKLGAADPISAEAIAGLKFGEALTAKIQRPRNPKHHRKLFALLKVVFDNQTTYATTEQLLEALKLATGLFETGLTVDRMPYVRPLSISFASMDQHSFNEFYDRAVDVILTKVLPNTDKADLEKQVLEILGEDYGKQRQ